MFHLGSPNGRRGVLPIVPFYSDWELLMEPGVPSGQPDGRRDSLPLYPCYSDRELLVESGVPPW